jgi:hypothetical protein
MSPKWKATFLAVVVVYVSALALFGCRGPATAPPPGTQSLLTVAEIDVGRSVATDKTIADKTDTFRPGDTFYVAVKTVGAAPTANLVARWSYEDGQRVSEGTQTISPSGPTVTEFHVSRPSGTGEGWPTGDYKVEIVLNGVSAGTEKFKVQ